MKTKPKTRIDRKFNIHVKHGMPAKLRSENPSPDAWEEHYAEVRQKCLQAKPAGEVVDFSDEIVFSMLIVRGIYAFDQKRLARKSIF